jgi:hypothetical protein
MAHAETLVHTMTHVPQMHFAKQYSILQNVLALMAI